MTERAPWMLRAEALVRGIERARVPLLGICFGHQMIAQALGGEVRKNPRGREIGTVRVTRRLDDPLFAGLPRTFDVNATGGSASVAVTGGGGNDTLVGPNATNTWNITGTNAGNVAGVAFTAFGGRQIGG